VVLRLRALLLSGGIESTALALMEKPDICLTVNYGQPPAVGEIRSSRAICRELGLEHEAIALPVYVGQRSPLMEEGGSLFWPLRNQLLVTIAGIHFASRNLSEVMIGVVEADIYSDCTPSFVDALNCTLEAQEAGFVVSAPAIGMSTLTLLKKAKVPRSLLPLTLSCHVTDYACGSCAGCRKSKTVLKKYRPGPSLSLVASK
jgi:7-cyano-7-deazaguanine synthase